MSSYAVREQLGSTIERYKLDVIKEPRGVIRIFQLVFSVITAVVLKFYSGYVKMDVCDAKSLKTVTLPIEYPFNLAEVSVPVTCNNVTSKLTLLEDFSIEAEFLYSTCWISIIVVLIFGVVYVKFRDEYESNGSLALADFVVSVILAVLWIASFGEWAYGQSNLKEFTHPDYLKSHVLFCTRTPGMCSNVVRGGLKGLTISLILSFLNFFLWAAGLWFVYKETPWYPQYQQRQ